VKLENQVARCFQPRVFHVVHFARRKINNAMPFKPTTHCFHAGREHDDRHIMGICVACVTSARLQFGEVHVQFI
jgi:hypothetical protein